MSSNVSDTSGNRDNVYISLKDDSRAKINLNEETKDKEATNKPKTQVLSRLLTYTKRNCGLILLASMFLLLASASVILSPIICGKIIDSIAEDKSAKGLQENVLYFIYLCIAAAAFSFVRGFLFNVTGERVVRDIRRDLFQSIMLKDVEFFDTRKTGDLISRIGSDTSVIQSTASTNISEILRGFTQTIGSMSLVFAISWKLTLVLLTIVPLFSCLALVISTVAKKLTKAYQEAVGECSSLAEESISNIRIVKAFSSENKEIQSYNQKTERTYAFGKRLAMMYATFLGSATVVVNGMIIGVLWLGGKMVLNKEITSGELTSFVIYALTIAASVSSLASVINNTITSLGAAERIFEVIDYQPKINATGGEILKQFRGQVEFENVTFSYPSKPEVQTIKDLSLKINSGDVVAIVGSSGSGKSTIISLIERFYDTQSGRILFDGVDLKTLDLRFLHQAIGLVAQEPSLFSGTIEENITYGIKDYTQEDLDQITKLAHAYDFIHNKQMFPQGYKTVVGERGVKLSGGQKQRIAIARALMKRPKVLIFDEATSALDAESEYQVQTAIDGLIHSGHVTMIIVAHRLSTIINCQRILVMQQGSFVEEGTHPQLLAKNGVYKALVERQVQGFNVE